MVGKKSKIAIDYIKSNYFRVLHVDGLGVQITPKLGLQIILWSERASIPKRVVFEVDEEGRGQGLVDDEIENRDSIVREIDASFTLDPELAEQLIEKLEEAIGELQAVTKEGDQDKGGEHEDNS